ncbi:coiled-coil domain-containing protein 102B isoform X2 [Pteronotus mesoamericanus]|uniref:coiled-coil domain-containing protein 102B isoform X1 n=1 Tax=Pteronotus mesoamericanus TaxID=1884717 RepID=UPI0023ECFA76|nr:coiled-coil domain-containing protein 102B isoform X1 [Pteronotus parnellii mesoamericanus]XP_054439753.1 coiled-coil domain-containing protein 102B isoform X2 [Pteronotus parnellii mesoamericanus]
MNLDSIYRLIEETQIFRMQPSSVTPPRDMVAPASAPRGTCDSCLPLRGPQPPAAPHFWAPSGHPGEWDICEELRLRELEEAKARAAQMEKTMRWWSDCTANWREKWSKVRAERNSAREEGRQLRMKLEMTVKELSALKKRQSSPHPKEASDARATQHQTRPSFIEVSCVQRDQFRIGLPTCKSTRECLVKGEFLPKENTGSMEEGLVLDPLRPNEEMKLPLDCPDSFKNGGSASGAIVPGLRHPVVTRPLENEVPEISALQVHLDEFQKISRKEREMHSSLEKEIGRLESAVSLWKRKYEELKESMFKNRSEFTSLHGQRKNEMEELSGDMKERSKSQESQDRVMYEFQAEELLDLQHAYQTLSRQYQAKIAELTRANHRADQNAAEGKKLKCQVEELRERLNQKEDKLDDALNQIRKLQRLLDDQKEANENLETELKHLQNR